MRALCAALEWPQHRYRTLHVVGTNGKSSVTTMAAALLAGAGLEVGACVSPHVNRWAERTWIAGTEIEPEAFAAAAAQVAAAIAAVEPDLEEGERITQFEAAIAVSFVAFADAGVDAAVIEAGLGGRLDATNVIDSTATALTSVGLDHVQFLGPTVLDIGAEKLAVLRDGTILITGKLDDEVATLAGEIAAERRADLVVAPALAAAALPAGFVPFLARDAAVAVALAETVTAELDDGAIAAALASARLPGRAELLAGDPPWIADAAHNAAGAEALAEALPALAGGRPVIACMSLLADKDAAAIAAALAPRIDHCVCTAADPGPAMGRPGSRALDAAGLAGALDAAGVGSEAVADPAAAIARTSELARARGGVALGAGSHYLLRYVWSARRDQSCSR
jgi:dihydrofolate synthase/folylpolyglutamate synthase